MLQITVPDRELWDERSEIFVYIKGQKLQLEHSLVSLSKWEEKYCKPFLIRDEKTSEEIKDYVKCMTLTQNVNPDVYDILSNENLTEIKNYIEAPMTATRFSDTNNQEHSGEQITAELIYYQMIALNIPFECRKWHLNKLLTLIKVCSIKNQPPKKRSTREIMRRNSALNAARRKQYSTRG